MSNLGVEVVRLATSAALETSDRFRLESGAPARFSPLSFVNGGAIWLATEAGAPAFRHALPIQGRLQLCAVLSPAAAELALIGTVDAGPTAFGLFAPPF